MTYVSTGELIALVGMTERQIHHWRRCGYISPVHGGRFPGSGNHVLWDEAGVDQARRLKRAADLLAVGLHDGLDVLADELDRITAGS